MPVAGEKIGISSPHRAQQRLVAHRASIDIEELLQRVAAIVDRQTCESGKVNAFPFSLDLQRAPGELPPEYLRQTSSSVPGAIVEGLAVAARQRETHLWKGDGNPLDNLGDRRGLSPVALQEFQPCRGGVEQVSHFDDSALCKRNRLGLRHLSAGDLDAPGIDPTPCPAGNRQPRHRADRWQRLTTKAECADIEQVLAQFGSAVPFDAQ